MDVSFLHRSWVEGRIICIDSVWIQLKNQTTSITDQPSKTEPRNLRSWSPQPSTIFLGISSTVSLSGGDNAVQTRSVHDIKSSNKHDYYQKQCPSNCNLHCLFLLYFSKFCLGRTRFCRSQRSRFSAAVLWLLTRGWNHTSHGTRTSFFFGPFYGSINQRFVYTIKLKPHSQHDTKILIFKVVCETEFAQQIPQKLFQVLSVYNAAESYIIQILHGFSGQSAWYSRPMLQLWSNLDSEVSLKEGNWVTYQ